MSTSGSPADTPEFALPAETTSGENTVATVSSHSVLTDRRSNPSGSSQTPTWNVISQSGQTGVTPMNSSMEVRDRSRQTKRSDHRSPTRSPRSSKSPRGDTGARGSDIPMTADQRLDQLLRESMRENERGNEEQGIRNPILGSPPINPISPSRAATLASPPRELTRVMPLSPQDIPINDITSDENGRDVVMGNRNPNERLLMLNDEVVEMTQRHLISEFELAELANHVSEAETHEQNLQFELSQEIHMFNQARSLVLEMRETFSIEDQGCIQRIEMLETQRNEFATGLIEVGNRAEMVLQERHAEHVSELQMVKSKAEEYIGFQNRDIMQLRHEISQMNDQLQRDYMRREQSAHQEREIERINGMLSNELLSAKANSQKQEAEVSLMRTVMDDRASMLNSEIAGLRSTLQNQNAQMARGSGYTDEEIRSYLTRKLAMIRDEYHQEASTQQVMIQSEGDVARMYKGRYELIVQNSLGKDPSTDQVIHSLKNRLENEGNSTKLYMNKHGKASEELSEVTMKLKGEEFDAKQNAIVLERVRRRLEEEDQIRSRLDRKNRESKDEMAQRDEQIEYLESEVDRLRDDRNERRTYNQDLYEQLWEYEEYGAHEMGEEAHAEAAESGKTESSESKTRISRRESDKVVVPPWPKSHDLDGWKSQLMANVLSACADPDQEAWISWIGESFKMNPDITKMSDSGGNRFTTIDVKLSNALNAMIASSGDNGKEVGMEIKVMILDLARKNHLNW